MSTQLDDEQLDLLYDAQKLDDPVLMEADTIDRTRQLLGAALEAYTGVRDGSDLPLDKQVNQLIEDVADDDQDVDLSALAQHPETGSADPEDVDQAQDALAGNGGDDGVDLEDALRSAPRDVRKDAASAVAVGDRLPRHSEELRESVADALSLSETPSVDDLREAGYKDPRRV